MLPGSQFIACSTHRTPSLQQCIQPWKFKIKTYENCGPGSVVGIATELRAGRSGDRIPVGARFSATVQTGSGAHPASCTMDSGSFPGVKSSLGVTLTPHPLLVLRSWKSIAIPLPPYGPYGLYRTSVPVQGCTLPLPKSTPIPLLPLWAVRSVQSLSACRKVHLYLYLYLYSPYGPYGLYRASVPVQPCILPLPYHIKFTWIFLCFVRDSNSVISNPETSGFFYKDGSY